MSLAAAAAQPTCCAWTRGLPPGPPLPRAPGAAAAGHWRPAAPRQQQVQEAALRPRARAPAGARQRGGVGRDRLDAARVEQGPFFACACLPNQQRRALTADRATHLPGTSLLGQPSVSCVEDAARVAAASDGVAWRRGKQIKARGTSRAVGRMRGRPGQGTCSGRLLAALPPLTRPLFPSKQRGWELTAACLCRAAAATAASPWCYSAGMGRL